MNELFTVTDDGIIEVAIYDTAEEAISKAKDILATDKTIFALKIEFRDGTTAVVNKLQVSEILI